MSDTQPTFIAPDKLIGTTVDGRFRIIEEVGSGGTGVVYRAHHNLLARDVAVKVLRSHCCENEISLARFRREAQATLALQQSNIVQTLGAGTLDDGRPFLVLEFVQGRSLYELLAASGPLPWAEALQIFVGIAAGLEHAHRKGIVHRDIKPSNIMIADNAGQAVPRILDFGLAGLLASDDNSQKLTKTNAGIFGSPPYMSPEHCRQQAIDARSDLYSFGCLMYETLSGKPPFEGDSPLDVMFKHVHQKPAALAKALGIPAPLQVVVFKALEKEPSKRYQTAAELLEDLRRCAVISPPPAAQRKKFPIELGPVALAIVFGASVLALASVFFFSDDFDAALAPVVARAFPENTLALGDDFVHAGMLRTAKALYIQHIDAARDQNQYTIDRLNAKIKLADAQLLNGELQEARAGYSDVFKIIGSSIDPEHHEVGFYHPELDRADLCEQIIQLSSQLVKELGKHGDLSESDYAQKLARLGTKAKDAGLWEAALPFFEKGVQLRLQEFAQGAPGKNDADSACHQLAYYWYGRGAIEYAQNQMEANKCFDRAIAMAERELQIKNAQGVTNLAWFADVHSLLSEAYYAKGDQQCGRAQFELGRKQIEAFGPYQAQSQNLPSWRPIFYWYRSFFSDLACRKDIVKTIARETQARYSDPRRSGALGDKLARYHMGVIFYVVDHDSATQWFERLIGSCRLPEDIRAYAAANLELAYIHTEKHDLPTAQKMFETAVTAMKGYPQLFHNDDWEDPYNHVLQVCQAFRMFKCHYDPEIEKWARAHGGTGYDT